MEEIEGGVKLVKKMHGSRRTNRIGIKHHIVRDAVDDDIFRTVYFETEGSAHGCAYEGTELKIV